MAHLETYKAVQSAMAWLGKTAGGVIADFHPLMGVIKMGTGADELTGTNLAFAGLGLLGLGEANAGKGLVKNALKEGVEHLDEVAKGGLSFSNDVLDNFTKHAFAGGRHADLGISVETMASKGLNLVEQNMSLLKAGDNTLIGSINGFPKSFKAFVQDGKIISVNMYSGVSNRITKGNVLKFENSVW